MEQLDTRPLGSRRYPGVQDDHCTDRTPDRPICGDAWPCTTPTRQQSGLCMLDRVQDWRLSFEKKKSGNSQPLGNLTRARPPVGKRFPGRLPTIRSFPQTEHAQTLFVKTLNIQGGVETQPESAISRYPVRYRLNQRHRAAFHPPPYPRTARHDVDHPQNSVKPQTHPKDRMERSIFPTPPEAFKTRSPGAPFAELSEVARSTSPTSRCRRATHPPMG